VFEIFSQLVRMASIVPLAVAAELAPEGEDGPAPGWQEVRNVVRAVERFWAAPPIRAAAAGTSPEDAARELVRRLALADAGDPWDALWLREGLGFRWSEAAWDAGRSPRATLPEAGWRLPLHTGMGLSLALRVLAPLALHGAGPGVGPGVGSEAGAGGWGGAPADAVDRFLELCHKGSDDGCAGASFEALGLVARVLHPGRVAALDRAVRQVGAPWRESFWHGLGRGLYLTPVGSLPRPAPAAHALERARREAPDPVARRNAVSGVGWALTLVNVRHPHVVAAALDDSMVDAGRASGPAADGDALVDGVARATVVWADSLGARSAESEEATEGAGGVDEVLEAFLESPEAPPGRGEAAPDGAERRRELWRNRVAPQCRQALCDWLVAGRVRDRFGDLFRVSVPG